MKTKRQRGDYNETSSFRQSLKTSWFASRKCISAPSADVVTVSREEWALLREIERYARIRLPGTTFALQDIDALRSGEVGKEGAG